MLQPSTCTSTGRRFSFVPFVLAAIVLPLMTTSAATRLGTLKVSENRRFLVHEDGTPFFYLGDTAWELFHRLNREEADRYLEDRAAKGFTVIQAVALAELDGLHAPNSYGHRPLVDDDPTKPDVKDGSSNDYWDHVDYIVQKAESCGLYIGLLPTWGDKWNKKWGVGPEIFTPQNAEVYGRWLGQRYRDAANIIWILGGDRPVENDVHKEIIRAMARGLAQGDGGRHLMTLHPTGGQTSAIWFHEDDWLDFNMRQNGHVAEYTGRYDGTRADYDRTPAKPVIDGEPIYEDHPVSFDAKKLGHSISSDVRRPLYWDLFGGAFGHTYGHHSVWQMWQPGRDPINNPLMPWFEAIDQPGAGQMQYARWLMESRPFLSRVPDDSILVTDRVATSVPGAGRYRFAGARDADGSYAMVYAPIGRAFKVRMDVVKGEKVKAWWYNPRNGQADAIGEFPNAGEREFLPPDKGEMLDWVLVLDDASRDFPPPGARARTTLGVEGTRFTLNGRPAFLLGVSYYGGLGASQDAICRDLDDVQRYGFNWFRVWATWGLGDTDVSAVDSQGLAKEPFLGRLKWLVAECDRRGLAVDVTLTRDAGGRLPDFAAHQRAVTTLVEALKTHRNWYLDLGNERDIRDGRYVPISEIKVLRDQVRRLDPQRLVTASFGGHDLSEEDVRESLATAGLDFLCPHRPRHAGSPQETEERTRELLALMEKIGRAAPVHYQEPFRRGYTDWEPAAADFVADLRGAVAGGAAGWCLHNGIQRNAPDLEPRRSFDLGSRRLFDQLDSEERKVVAQAAEGVVAAAQWTLVGPLGETPKRITDSLPLSHQSDIGVWLRYEPMSDEFEGGTLDANKWVRNMEWWKGRQPALFKAENVTVEDGQLLLTMRKEPVPEEFRSRGYHDYTSAALHSLDRTCYGYFEVKARPMDSGGSSSFWFQQDATPDWATEIDVFEIGGKAKGHENKYHMNVHVFRTPAEKRHWSIGGDWDAPWRLADDFHVYGLEWDREVVKYYVDGVLVRWVRNTHWHQPLYLIFDSETMPDWFDMPDDKDLPSTFRVEYVRAWKKQGPGN